MVQLGHGLRAPLSAASALRDGAIHGLAALPTELFAAAPPPSGEPVPFFGYLNVKPSERLTYAEGLLATHRPDSGFLTLSWSWLPIRVNRDRRCLWCRSRWRCPTAEWAHTTIALSELGRAL